MTRTSSARGWLRFAISALLISSVAWAAPSPASAQAAKGGPDKIKLGALFLGGSTHLYAAKKLGYFERQNLDVELSSLGGGAQVVPLIVSGDLHVGMINQVSWMLALQQGYDLVAIGATSKEVSEKPFSSNVYVLEDSPIRRAKDLEGKRVATNTLNNIVTLYTNEWVRKDGGDPKNIQWTEVPLPRTADTLLNKRVDAAFLVEPFGTILQGTGKARIVGAPLAEVYPKGMFFSVLAAKREWVEKNEDAARRLVTAAGQAVERVMNDTPLRRDLMAEFTKMEPDLIKKLIVDEHIIKIDPPAIDLTMGLMIKDGMLKQPLPIEKYIWKSAPRTTN